MRRRRIARTGATGLSLLIGILLAGAPAQAVRNPIQGSSISVEAAGAVETLDPIQATTPAERLLVANLFDRLVRRAADGGWQPSAATSWQVSADSLEWKFVLRVGMTFTDGRPVDAEAVVRSWNRSNDGKARRRLRGTMTADAGGVLTLRLTGAASNPLARLADPSFGIAAANDGPNDGTLVGSGPFRLTRSPRAGEFVLVPRVDHRLGRAMPAGVVVTSRPAQKEPIVGPRDVLAVIADPTSGTLDFSMAFTDGTTPDPLPPRTTPR